MFSVVITEKGGAQRRMDFDKSEVTIGRVQGNDIILPKGNVSKRHSRIVLKDNRFIVVDLKSTNGTYVNGRKITSPLVVKPGDKIYIGDFILTVEDSAAVPAATVGYEEPRAAAPPPEPLPRSEPPPRRVEPPPLAPEPPAARASAPPPLPAQRAPQPAAVEPPPTAPPAPAPRAGPERFPLEEEPMPAAPSPPPAEVAAQAGPTSRPAPLDVGRPAMPALTAGAGPIATGDSFRVLMGRLSATFDVMNADAYAMQDRGRAEQARNAIQAILNAMSGEGALEPGGTEALAAAALREAVGLGALEPFLGDESIREIIVEGSSSIVADHGSGFQPVKGSFSSNAAVYAVARRLIAQAGVMDHGQAVYQFGLPYGPHVTVVLPPVAVKGPLIEVRRVGKAPSVDDLVSRGMLNQEMSELLTRAVASRKNVAVVGPAGAGVTTVLSMLATCFGREERVVTAEDVPDLQLVGDHVLPLAAGGPGSRIGLVDVMQQAARLRSDRLIIDDVRDGAAFDALALLAARGQGSLLGVHLVGGDDPVAALRALAGLHPSVADGAADALVGRALHMVIQLGHAAEAPRMLRITELGEKGPVDLFTYDGSFASTGNKPSF